MPLVTAVNILADGFEIVMTAGGTIAVASTDFTTLQLLLALVDLEPLVNNLLAARLPAGMFAAVHLTSAVPLRGTLTISNDPQ